MQHAGHHCKKCSRWKAWWEHRKVGQGVSALRSLVFWTSTAQQQLFLFYFLKLRVVFIFTSCFPTISASVSSGRWFPLFSVIQCVSAGSLLSLAVTFVVLHFHCLEAENLWLHHHIIKSACLWGSHSVVGERLLGQLLLPPLHQVVPNRPSMSSRVIHRLVLKRKTLNWAVADTSLLGSGDSKSMNGCHFPQQKSAFISCMSLDGTLPDRLLETMTEEAKQTDEHTTV